MTFAEFVGNSAGTSLGSPVAMTIPAEVQAGDLLIMVGSHQAVNGSTIVAPAGWNLVASFGTQSWVAVFSRRAGGGDAGSGLILETGDTDSPLFGGAAACIAAYRGSGANLAALSAVQYGVGSQTLGIATAASINASESAAILGLFGSHSVSGADMVPFDPTRAIANSGKAAIAVSERLAPISGPTGPAQSAVGGSDWVAWNLEILVDVQTVLPPCRLYPREDGLATSSATRIFPQPRSQQGGLRQAGGTYY